eukprot:jgi/Mesen1/10675/ME000009S10470
MADNGGSAGTNSSGAGTQEADYSRDDEGEGLHLHPASEPAAAAAAAPQRQRQRAAAVGQPFWKSTSVGKDIDRPWMDDLPDGGLYLEPERWNSAAFLAKREQLKAEAEAAAAAAEAAEAAGDLLSRVKSKIPAALLDPVQAFKDTSTPFVKVPIAVSAGLALLTAATLGPQTAHDLLPVWFAVPLVVGVYVRLWAFLLPGLVAYGHAVKDLPRVAAVYYLQFARYMFLGPFLRDSQAWLVRTKDAVIAGALAVRRSPRLLLSVSRSVLLALVDWVRALLGLRWLTGPLFWAFRLLWNLLVFVVRSTIETTRRRYEDFLDGSRNTRKSIAKIAKKVLPLD